MEYRDVFLSLLKQSYLQIGCLMKKNLYTIEDECTSLL